MPSDIVLESVRSQSEAAASVHFQKRTDSPNDFSSLTQTASGPQSKKRIRIRDAESNECKLFAISVGESTLLRLQADAQQALLATGPDSAKVSVERLLSAANGLNQICRITEIDNRIEELLHRHEECRMNLEQLDAVYRDNKREVERLTKAVAHQKQQRAQQEAQVVPKRRAKARKLVENPPPSAVAPLEPEALHVSEPSIAMRSSEPHIEEPLEAVDPTRARETEASQDTMVEEHAPSDEQATKTTVIAAAETTALPVPEEPSPMQASITPRAPSSLRLQKSSQETQELQLPTFKSATPEEAQVMAHILAQLRNGPVEGVSITKLRESASHFATTHDMSAERGVKSIYKLNSLKLLELDRSKAETVVRLIN
ncbi:hypothetical protein BCR43DRAFT_563321 [Syncephalastrum racemosum]|uniref:Uncharacterized protein n=1 Tax=Syncephalastrum racemosum TaxID=13706 RepID=A0A1X2HGF3_SYNRA|nr:hypothetical protein BCR43DRAFT_563321 [Syncephalastrum racemosum]